MQDHLKYLRHALTEAPVQPPPPPWQAVASIAIGGLTHVGYAPDSDLLLVVSSQGRGVIDCLSGSKVARDPEEFFDGFDEVKLSAPGIGPLVNQSVRVGGLSGGGLPTSTRDGWRLQAIPLPWPNYSIFLSLPWKSVIDGLPATTKVGTDGACELRAYGFSETGNTFVIALSCQLDVFCRAQG